MAEDAIYGEEADGFIEEIEAEAARMPEPLPPAFEKLAEVRAVLKRCAEKGYGDDDPLYAFVQLATVLDRRAVQLHALSASQGEALSDAMVALMSQLQLFSEKVEVVLDAYQSHQEQLARRDALNQDLAEAMCDMVAAVENHTGEFERAAEIIENRSTIAVVLGWLSPAMAFVAGFLICKFLF